MNTNVILALDLSSRDDVIKTAQQFQGKILWVKVGMELFYKAGPQIISDLKAMGFKIFLDLKLHDIPTTVSNALKNLCEWPIDMINIHALGGAEMMAEAFKAVSLSKNRPLLIAVTQLTSTNDLQFKALGFNGSLNENVTKLAKLAAQCGLNGVVCSAHEVTQIKNACGKDFLCITPGIRFKNDSSDDQKRVMTPDEAILNGSDFLVMGRSLINNPENIKLIK